MKKTIVTILVLSLAFAALTGCGAMDLRPDDGTNRPQATNGNTVSPSPAVNMPDMDDGIVRDDDGIITDDDTGALSSPDAGMQHRSGNTDSTTREGTNSSALPAATPDMENKNQ